MRGAAAICVFTATASIHVDAGERLAVTGSSAGADTSALQDMAELLEPDWLPGTALSDS